MRRVFVGVVFCLGSLAFAVLAQPPGKQLGITPEIIPSPSYKAVAPEASADLRSILNAGVEDLLKASWASPFKQDEIAATLIDLRDPANIRWADHRGEAAIYPASVVKMFFMAALHQQIQDGKVTLTPELERGLRDMIVDSSNEATQYILDVLTDTASGAELPQEQFEIWQHKRNRVNRYFSSMGYTGINVNQKTFCEDAYGIEQQSRGYKGQNRNMLTTNATARLLAEIALGRVVSVERSRQMMLLMLREPFKASKDLDSQSTAFIGKTLADKKMTDSRLWSKAGWTSKSRHDAAYIETADGRKFVLVVFTENHATEKDAIPFLAGKIIERLRN